MAINALEIGLFENLVRGSSKAIKTPEQVAAELKFHIQKEIDAQFLQNQFTANDIPPIDSFQRQNQPDDDDPNNPKKKPKQPLPTLPIGVPPKIKQWLG
jgi:hypothetical protein